MKWNVCIYSSGAELPRNMRFKEKVMREVLLPRHIESSLGTCGLKRKLRGRSTSSSGAELPRNMRFKKEVTREVHLPRHRVACAKRLKFSLIIVDYYIEKPTKVVIDFFVQKRYIIVWSVVQHILYRFLSIRNSSEKGIVSNYSQRHITRIHEGGVPCPTHWLSIKLPFRRKPR